MSEVSLDERMSKLEDELSQLRDLFVRRLSDDKTKTRLCDTLTEQNQILNRHLEERLLEGLFREFLLVCDRIESNSDGSDFLLSIKDEILEIFARREVRSIEDVTLFDPLIHKAVGTASASEEQEVGSIVSVVKNGYLIQDRVLRAAEVIVAIDKAE